MPGNLDVLIDGKTYSVNWTKPTAPTDADVDGIRSTLRAHLGLKPPKSVPGAAFGSQDMTPKNVAYGSQNGVQQLNAQGQVVQPTGPTQIAYGSQDVSAKPSTAALRANETPTQTLQRIQNRIQQDQASQTETATRNQGALRTSARTPLGIPVTPEPATDRRTRLIQEGTALFAQMKKAPTKQGAMRLAQIQNALKEIADSPEKTEALKKWAGIGKNAQDLLAQNTASQLDQNVSAATNSVMGAVHSAARTPSNFLYNWFFAPGETNSLPPADINTPGLSPQSKTNIKNSKYDARMEAVHELLGGDGINESVYTDTPAGRLSGFAQDIVSYGIPVLGQAGMVAQGVDLGQQLAKDPKGTAEGLYKSFNFLEPGISGDEKVMRGVNLILAVVGGKHAKEFIDDTMLIRDLTNRFLMTPEQAKTVVDLARKRIGVQNGTIQNFLKQAGGGDVRAGAKRIAGQMSADMLAKGKPETVAGPTGVGVKTPVVESSIPKAPPRADQQGLVTAKNPDVAISTAPKKVAPLSGQTVDAQGFGNELPGVGKQRVAKPVLTKVEGTQTPVAKPMAEAPAAKPVTETAPDVSGFLDVANTKRPGAPSETVTESVFNHLGEKYKVLTKKVANPAFVQGGPGEAFVQGGPGEKPIKGVKQFIVTHSIDGGKTWHDSKIKAYKDTPRESHVTVKGATEGAGATGDQAPSADDLFARYSAWKDAGNEGLGFWDDNPTPDSQRYAIQKEYILRKEAAQIAAEKAKYAAHQKAIADPSVLTDAELLKAIENQQYQFDKTKGAVGVNTFGKHTWRAEAPEHAGIAADLEKLLAEQQKRNTQGAAPTAPDLYDQYSKFKDDGGDGVDFFEAHNLSPEIRKQFADRYKEEGDKKWIEQAKKESELHRKAVSDPSVLTGEELQSAIDKQKAIVDRSKEKYGYLENGELSSLPATPEHPQNVSDLEKLLAEQRKRSGNTQGAEPVATPSVEPTPEPPKPRQSRTVETGDALQRAWNNASRRSQKRGAGYSPFFDHNVQAALVDHAIAHIKDGVANVKDFVKSVTDQYGGLGADFVDAVKSHADDIWAAAQKRIAEPQAETSPVAKPTPETAKAAPKKGRGENFILTDPEVLAAFVDLVKANFNYGKEKLIESIRSSRPEMYGKGAPHESDLIEAMDSVWERVHGKPKAELKAEPTPTPQSEPATHAASNASTNASRTRVGLPEGEATDEPTVAAMNRKTQEFMTDFGLGEHEKVEKQKVQDWRDEAKATGTTVRAVEIAKKINEGTKQRLSDVETVAMAERAKELINESKSQGVTTERLGEISNDLTDIAKATKKAGSAWGREGIARRVEIALNTDKHMVRARAEIAYEKTVGRDLTDTERAEISKSADEAHAKWVEAEKRLKEVQAKNEKLKAEAATPEARAKAKAQAERVIDSMVKTTERRAAKAENKVIRKAAADNIMRKLGRALIGSSPFHALAEIAPDLKVIAKSYISDGIITLQGVTDGVITTVKELTGHQLSENDVHRALGGLEDPEPQAQTLESQHMSRIRSLSYLSGRIEEVLDGSYTPPERKTVHDEVKALRRIYNDLLKEKGLVSGKGMSRERSLMNAIDRALHVLENGPAEKPVRRPDTKAEAELRAQLDALKKQVKEKYGGKPPKADAEKIAKIESQLAKLARGEDISGKPRTPESAEVQAARKNLRVARSMADIDAKFKALKELHSTEPRKPGEKPDPKVAAYREMYRQEEIKNRAKVQAEMYKSAIGNPEMADRLLAKRQTKKYPADLLKAKSDARAAKQNLIDFQKSYQYKPFFDKLHDWSMSNSLLNVMSRQIDLAANATKLASKAVTSPLSSAIGRHLARKYGKDIIAPERNMISRDTMRAMNDFWPRWKQEMSDVWHSKDADSMHKFDYQGNAMDQGRFTKALHNASTIAGRAAGLTDAPFKDTYQSVVYGDMAAHRFPGDLAKQDAMVRQLQGTTDHGPLSDVDMEHMQTVAHEIALRETFNNENVISKAHSSIDRGIRKSIEEFLPGKGGKEVAAAASFALKVFTRFSKVIGNVAWERFLRSGAGILVGKAEVKMLKSAGLDDLQIRTISDHFAKGLTGTAMVALGYIMAQKGLVKTPVVTTKSSQYVDWGDLAQYGGLISPWLFGAQMWTAANDPQIKNRNGFAANTILDLLLDQPAVTGLKRFTDLTDSRTAGKTLASIISGLLIPSGLSDIARRLDAHNNPDVKNRKVENFIDASKARIPGLRETLPDSGSSKLGLRGLSAGKPRM